MTTRDSEKYVMSGWQKAAYAKGTIADFFLVDVPGGAGKSLLLAALAAYEREQDSRRKVLICVPQSHISEGFGPKVIQVGSSTLEFRLDHNLCNLTLAKVARLRDFLLGDDGGIVVCTHAGLARLWTSLDSTTKKRAVRRLTLTVDEAHHLAGVMTGGDLEPLDDDAGADFLKACPILSEMVRCMTDQPGCKLRLATATLYRGDRAVILGEQMRKKFVEYRLSWEEYFPKTGIESIQMAFELYDPDPIEQIVRRVRREPHRRHLIILPKRGQRFSNALTSNNVLARLSKVFKPDQILDLVTTKMQKQNKRALFAQPDKYHAVVACCLFNEGTDWPICDMMHNADACERSATLAMQRFYRPLRRYPGKKEVTIISYLPRFSSDLPKKQQKRILKGRLNALLTRLVLEGEVDPVLVFQKKHRKTVTLAQLYGAATHQEVLQAMVVQYESLTDKHDSKEVLLIVDRIIERYGVPERADPGIVRLGLERQLLRITQPLKPLTTLALNGVSPHMAGHRTFSARFKAQGAHGSSVFFDSERIDAALFCRMAESASRVLGELSREEIADGILAFVERTGERPHCKTPMIEELRISGRALDMRLRHRGSSLSDVTAAVTNRPRRTSMADIQQGIFAYYRRTGEWPTTRTGLIAEIGLHSGTIQTRLRGMDTSLAKVVASLRSEAIRVSA